MFCIKVSSNSGDRHLVWGQGVGTAVSVWLVYGSVVGCYIKRSGEEDGSVFQACPASPSACSLVTALSYGVSADAHLSNPYLHPVVFCCGVPCCGRYESSATETQREGQTTLTILLRSELLGVDSPGEGAQQQRIIGGGSRGAAHAAASAAGAEERCSGRCRRGDGSGVGWGLCNGRRR